VARRARLGSLPGIRLAARMSREASTIKSRIGIRPWSAAIRLGNLAIVSVMGVSFLRLVMTAGGHRLRAVGTEHRVGQIALYRGQAPDPNRLGSSQRQKARKRRS